MFVLYYPWQDLNRTTILVAVKCLNDKLCESWNYMFASGTNTTLLIMSDIFLPLSPKRLFSTVSLMASGWAGGRTGGGKNLVWTVFQKLWGVQS